MVSILEDTNNRINSSELLTMPPNTQISNKENNGTQRESPIEDVEAQRKNMEQIENVDPPMVSPPDRGIADPTPLGLLSFATGRYIRRLLLSTTYEFVPS